MSTPRGLTKLLSQIRRLKPAQVKAAGLSLAQGAEELSSAIQRAAPQGKTGALKRSVGWSKGGGQTGQRGAAAKGEAAVRGGALGEAGLRVTVHAGDEVAYYAKWVEFGTKASAGEAPRQNRNFRRSGTVMTKGKRAHAATPAQPYFWPTVRAQKKRLKSRVARNANKALKAAVAGG